MRACGHVFQITTNHPLNFTRLGILSTLGRRPSLYCLEHQCLVSSDPGLVEAELLSKGPQIPVNHLQ